MPKNLLSFTGAAALVAGVWLQTPASATETPVVRQPLTDARQQLTIPAPAANGSTPAANAIEAPEKAPDVIASIEKPKLTPAFESGRIPFTVTIGGIDTSWSTMSAFVMPGEALEFSASNAKGPFAASAGEGKVEATGAGQWKWTAPAKPGNHSIRVQDISGGKKATIEVFVLTPYDGNGVLGTYKIGSYRKSDKYKDSAYNAPAGFVEVTAQNIDKKVSPHFRLGQFLCKDPGKFPKYVALKTALLVKLEALIEALAERGLPAETLHVMSGYRTPAYNAGIGNETTFSRHTYGDAADVFLDRDGDGHMDDVNGDGAKTKDDARFIYKIIEESIESKLPPQLTGGLAAYSPNAAHGPFVHIDTRGKKARW